jgi:hypothetical protein
MQDVTERLDPPPGLSDDERRVWSRTVRLLDSVGLLDKAIASNSLAAYVRCFRSVALRDKRR